MKQRSDAGDAKCQRIPQALRLHLRNQGCDVYIDTKTTYNETVQEQLQEWTKHQENRETEIARPTKNREDNREYQYAEIKCPVSQSQVSRRCWTKRQSSKTCIHAKDQQAWQPGDNIDI